MACAEPGKKAIADASSSVDSNVLLTSSPRTRNGPRGRERPSPRAPSAPPCRIHPLHLRRGLDPIRAIEDLEEALPEEDFVRLPLPWEARPRREMLSSASATTRRAPIPLRTSTSALMRRSLAWSCSRATRRATGTYFPGLEILAP